MRDGYRLRPETHVMDALPTSGMEYKLLNVLLLCGVGCHLLTPNCKPKWALLADGVGEAEDSFPTPSGVEQWRRWRCDAEESGVGQNTAM